MLLKILIFVGSLIAVYVASKRHQIFANLMSRVSDNLGSKEAPPKQADAKPADTVQDEADQIEELDYDPETGRYSVRKKRKS
ncbi:hypothetical protein [Pararhizobium sp. IMCC21322]|uniref:hypothetical protein n=1 Tax=Pararhizobium sp. IMCC21322 TaxID=3067903 RepID=UPI002742151E|nr:hypothetical protein [Pararhizobium sp. IMCC21322]